MQIDFINLGDVLDIDSAKTSIANQSECASIRLFLSFYNTLRS